MDSPPPPSIEVVLEEDGEVTFKEQLEERYSLTHVAPTYLSSPTIYSKQDLSLFPHPP